MNIQRYTPEKQGEWDAFVRESRNGTFILQRSYMDYHSDRFVDHSLMYYNDKGKLLAVMPANVVSDCFYSHQGLTYGGFVLDSHLHDADLQDCFCETMKYLSANGFSKWYYKSIPTIYHELSSQEEDYWLWRCGAQTSVCNLSCVVDLRNYHHLVNKRKRSYQRSLARDGYIVRQEHDLSLFWQVLTDNLRATYGAAPVHTLDEITLLWHRFPENIKCCVAVNPQGQVEAGVLLFISSTVVKTQYISASPEGKRTKALDFLMLNVIDTFAQEGKQRFFDLGTSNEDGGRILNSSLYLQKEGYGGRGVAYKQYTIDL